MVELDKPKIPGPKKRLLQGLLLGIAPLLTMHVIGNSVAYLDSGKSKEDNFPWRDYVVTETCEFDLRLNYVCLRKSEYGNRTLFYRSAPWVGKNAIEFFDGNADGTVEGFKRGGFNTDFSLELLDDATKAYQKIITEKGLDQELEDLLEEDKAVLDKILENGR